MNSMFTKKNIVLLSYVFNKWIFHLLFIFSFLSIFIISNELKLSIRLYLFRIINYNHWIGKNVKSDGIIINSDDDIGRWWFTVKKKKGTRGIEYDHYVISKQLQVEINILSWKWIFPFSTSNELFQLVNIGRIKSEAWTMYLIPWRESFELFPVSEFAFRKMKFNSYLFILFPHLRMRMWNVN